MVSHRDRYTLWILPAALAVGIIGCGGDKDPTQPAAPTKLIFTVQPANAAGTELITPAVQVAVQDTLGNTITAATGAVTVALGGNSSAATLSGTLTVTAIQGIATFGNLRINNPGSYTLVASAAGRSGASSAPFSVTLTFAAVSAGDLRTCGLTAAGAAYCWGFNGFNGNSLLGDETTTNRSSPVLVAGGRSFVALSVGNGLGHTCGVTAAGATYCWGDNRYGQLGDGTTTHRSSPVLVAGGGSFSAVSAGGGHTCGVTAAGALYCWGRNFGGALGDGTTTHRSSPVLVAGGVSFAAVSAGGGHTCGVAAAGATSCWGQNVTGVLGDGTTTDRSSPVSVATGETFATVSAGDNHTCGVTAAGAAYCWGQNFYGQLGDGTTTNRFTPELVAGGVSFASVSAGALHACGLTAAGAAYCWGLNSDGRLGDGTTIGRLTPVPVASSVTFAAVHAGGGLPDNHSCGVTAVGVAYCWGSNNSGQLGDGTTTNRLTPVRVVQ